MIYREEEGLFHLSTNETSYIFRVAETGHLEHLYYGRRLRHRGGFPSLGQRASTNTGIEADYSPEHTPLSLNLLKLEFPGFGKTDFREPAHHILHADGSRVTDLRYESAKIVPGKPALGGLPAARAEDGDDVETLFVNLKDTETGVGVLLAYSVFEESNVIARSLRINNGADRPVDLRRVMSFNLDFAPGKERELITLDGAWIREKSVHRRPVSPGRFVIDGKRFVSGADHNPFLAVVDSDTGERAGDAYGIALVYSGNHEISAELNPHGILRVQGGINAFDFSWHLAPGENFQAPEALLTFSHQGLGGMSRNFHTLINGHIVPKHWRGVERPLLINSWEANYFDFDEKSLLKLAKSGRDLGLELFVLDDGWFKGRNDDTTSLGDWVVDRKKLPGGLSGLSTKIKAMGMKFGLWVEPEMVSPDSDLYRAHPEWAIAIPGRPASLGRNQLMLDLANPAVVDYLEGVLTAAFDEAAVDYVKWDMNRGVTDPYSRALEVGRQQEQAHRYVLGLYELLRRIVARFPDVLFESCASGGNRYDLGMLAFMPQTWTSDNTDPGSRMEIQHGSTYLYPQSTMGAHVGSDPSHQVLRNNGIENRFHVAAFGVLGVELDLTKTSNFERKVMAKQIEVYKRHRTLLQFGEFRRLRSPFEGNHTIWMVISPDRSEAMLFYGQKVQMPNGPMECIRLEGLEPGGYYRLETVPHYINIAKFGELINDYVPFEVKTTGVSGLVHKVVSDNYLYEGERQTVEAFGDEFMYAGFRPYEQFRGAGYGDRTRLVGDFGTRLYHIQRIEAPSDNAAVAEP